MNRQALLTAALLLCSTLTFPLFAGDSVNHSGRASTHSGKAAGHALTASAQVAVRVVAIPLAVGGAVGKASGNAAEGLWHGSQQQTTEPLPLSEQLFTAAPSPRQAMASPRKGQ